MSQEVHKPHQEVDLNVDPELLDGVVIPKGDEEALKTFRENYHQISVEMRSELLDSVKDNAKFKRLKNTSWLNHEAIIDIIGSIKGLSNMNNDFLERYEHLSPEELALLVRKLEPYDVEKYCADILFDSDGNITKDIDLIVIAWLFSRVTHIQGSYKTGQLIKRVIESWNSEVIDLYFAHMGWRAISMVFNASTEWFISISEGQLWELKKRIISEIREKPHMLKGVEQVNSLINILSQEEIKEASDFDIEGISDVRDMRNILLHFPEKRLDVLRRITAKMFWKLAEGMFTKLRLNASEADLLYQRWGEFPATLKDNGYINEKGRYIH
jgi:hypothetical protein